jgi:hypothetical protein
MIKNITRLFLILALAGTIAGCGKKVGTPTNNAETKQITAEAICQQTCQLAIISGQDLSAGPCLLNPDPENPDWVCDVAHNPRQAIDNIPANQCPAFAGGQAHHFVEISPDCQLIKIF